MDARVRKDRLRKELFAPLPIRAINDQRLTARHLRVLAAIAYHDRLGRNGQGCWAGLKRMAQETGISETHVSDMLSDLGRWGYVTSERNPMNRRTNVHRVIYDTSQIREVSSGQNTSHFGPNTSRFEAKHFPSENAKSLSAQADQPLIYINRTYKRDSAEAVSENSEFEKRDCAEARTTEVEKTKISEAESYLQAVNECTSDTESIGILKCEHARLSQIANDERMPHGLRDWAARLRGVAEGMR